MSQLTFSRFSIASVHALVANRTHSDKKRHRTVAIRIQVRIYPPHRRRSIAAQSTDAPRAKPKTIDVTDEDRNLVEETFASETVSIRSFGSTRALPTSMERTLTITIVFPLVTGKRDAIAVETIASAIARLDPFQSTDLRIRREWGRS